MATNRKKSTSQVASSLHGRIELSQGGLEAHAGSVDPNWKKKFVRDHVEESGQSSLHENATQASQAILELDQKIAELEVESDVLYTKINNMEEEADIQGKMQARTEYPELDGYGERAPYENRKKNIFLSGNREYQEARTKRKNIELEVSKLRAQKDHYHRMFKLQLSCIGSPNVGDLPESTEGGRLGGIFGMHL